MIEIIMSTDGWRLYLSTSVSKIRYSIGGNATIDRAVCLVLNLKKDLNQTGCFFIYLVGRNRRWFDAKQLGYRKVPVIIRMLRDEMLYVKTEIGCWRLVYSRGMEYIVLYHRNTRQAPIDFQYSELGKYHWQKRQ